MLLLIRTSSTVSHRCLRKRHFCSEVIAVSVCPIDRFRTDFRFPPRTTISSESLRCSHLYRSRASNVLWIIVLILHIGVKALFWVSLNIFIVSIFLRTPPVFKQMISSALGVAFMASYLLDPSSMVLAVVCSFFAPKSLIYQCPVWALKERIKHIIWL